MRHKAKNWNADEKVADATVAPHRYLWSGFDDDFREAKDFREFLAGVPYKAGEVVYVDCGGTATKARINTVWFEFDRFGDRRETYLVQLETKKGLWSKVLTKTWAGFVQRGYKVAGLAPDVKD